VLLTFDEEPNLGRTLESVRWAERVVIVDSGSTDATERIARSFPNVAFFVRRFDRHRDQWRFAIHETDIESEFVLALDADMAVTPAFVTELEKEFFPGGFAGGLVPIEWCYFGKPLRASFCPPQLRLFRGDAVQIVQAGHTQEFGIDGRIHSFASGVRHEDRKSLERWLQSQAQYSRLEQERLRHPQGLRPRDRLRRTGWMPAVAAILSYLRAGGPVGGKRALRYAWERATYECVLAIRVIDEELSEEEK
jgi:glycosyltransferase involved in cell wall biosynthesis